MAKKGKTTLRDLNKFLHREPNKLAVVDKISIDDSEQKRSVPTVDSIINEINNLAEAEGKPFGDVLIRLAQEGLENQKVLSAKELMLLNTLIYLENS